jgi:hypothetical protein
MNAKHLGAGLLVAIMPLLCASPGRADELDAGFSEPTPPPLPVPLVPAGLYLVTDVYAGPVVASSGNTTTYSTATVPDVPGTYARVIDVVSSGGASAFDDRSFNGRARLSDGRSIAGTYYEDYVLTPSGFVSVNIVFFQDDSETRAAAQPSPAPTGTPTPSSLPAGSLSPRVISSAAPSTGVTDPRPLVPAKTRQPLVVVATAGVALASDGPVLGSIEVLRGRTIVLWPRAFVDGLAVPIRSWRLVSGGADRLSPLAGSAADGCVAAWLSLPPGGAPSVLRFEVASDALPGRVMIASLSVSVRSPALMQ